MKKANVQLESLACPSCLLKIENALKRLDGVEKESIKVLYNASRARFNFDETKVNPTTIENAISKLGYRVLKITVK
ncbi:MAG TPA: heavy-metal-associated domain-containing protein [Bacilli bacterium]|nr:heavy-metal-associated domain-containing protein [Bacilli bacterium]